MKMFRVMYQRGREYPEVQVEWVPWIFVERYEEQAQRNHSQSLQTLSDRGGLSPMELYAMLHGKSWRDLRQMGLEISEEKCISWLLKLKHEGLLNSPYVPVKDPPWNF